MLEKEKEGYFIIIEKSIQGDEKIVSLKTQESEIDVIKRSR